MVILKVLRIKMSINQKKINIFIPIEIKKRELLSQVILSKFIIKNNKDRIRCYVGSKTQIRKLISFKKNYGGIYLYKGGLSINRIKAIKKKVEKFIILDQEMGPAAKFVEKEMPERIWKDSEKYIDRYYVIGKYAYNLAQKVLPKLKSKIIMTGWPKVDLWRAELLYGFNNSIKNLQKKYGNFILFSSDFGYNSQNRINLTYQDFNTSIWKSSRENVLNEMNWAKNILEDYKKTIELIQELDKRTDIPLIIIRPHPTEDLMEWKRVEKSLKRIKVIYEGEVSSWIYASSGVLHRGCTTAVQSYMAGIQAGFIVNKEERVFKTLSYKVSQKLYNSNDIAKFCIENIGKKPILPKEYIEAFSNDIHVEKKYASELIAEDMLKFNVTPELPYHPGIVRNTLNAINVIMINIKISIIKFLERNKQRAFIPDKMDGGITKKEISDILHNFGSDEKFKVRQVLIDCVEIEL